MTALTELLDTYRASAPTEREKGTYFERLIKDFLMVDPTYSPNFSAVWTYAEWAELQGMDKRDAGIDLVAQLSDETGYCAIQCKFYDAGHRIQKSDIDSFFAASGKDHFKRRLIVDSTRRDWSEHAEAELVGQTIPTQRIGLHELESSPIDWRVYTPNHITLNPKKQLRPHQQAALAAVKAGFSTADRGKLIMACGTGKTFTALKIAEQLAGADKHILFLVPSLSLMSQSITEWTIESTTPLRAYAVCSDNQVGKRKTSDDLADLTAHDLAYPATTNAQKLAAKMAQPPQSHMTVVFSTYQSIQVIADAQQHYGIPAFDLIICDEAHRTTGATLAGLEESNFVKIHDPAVIAGAKRLYMTATPRIFGDTAKTKANEEDVVLASMDDPALYGETLYTLNFSTAVQQGLLTDYKVLVLAVDETLVSATLQTRLTDENSELILDDVAKIIGCYRALAKLDLHTDVVADRHPMRRAVAFCRDIKSSKAIKTEFTKVVDDYLDSLAQENTPTPLHCEVDHVDGTYHANARNRLLSWLKEPTDDTVCRILSNARCLSEGVDVPALDAILFLHPRKSQIDVVQSVGRVMRRAEGKHMGYIILPVGVPAGIPPEQALNRNEKYKVIWDTLNALRAHDERMDATVNKIGLGADVSNQIEIIAISNTLPNGPDPDQGNGGHIGSYGGESGEAWENNASGNVNESPANYTATQTDLPYNFDDFQKAIYAKIVKKCGKRAYWENWANDIATIAQTHITRITGLLQHQDSPEHQAFAVFLNSLREDLNASITEAEAIEMLAQHIITKPVFDALFEGYRFTENNPVSMAMQAILDTLESQHLEKEAKTLQKFYDSVKLRAAGIDNAEGKQRIIVELYDKFFRNAFPKMTERLGIVYTPVEVVDFILHSVNDALQNEFAQTLGDPNVHIIDPFTGTGTFITRLLQSGLISPEQLAYKYQHEIHANEIVLLAYYIAAINIEAVYHSLVGGDHRPFNGICLTDTFQLHEKDLVIIATEADANRCRRQKQKALDIRVIIGNPPYSAGQNSANDNNQNIAYPTLDNRIRTTYAEHSKAASTKNLMDSYIRAIRWASDRIGNSGVIGFVSNASFIDGNSMDGLRHCLAEEFSSIYIFHLRGNQRTSGELSRKEGGKIFGSGSRAPIAISILVKNPQTAGQGNIHLHDIGDYLTREQKLATVSHLKSINGITAANGWQKIQPDPHNDWLKQRDDSFSHFISLGDKKDKIAAVIFENYSLGIGTNRDVWCYQSSRNLLNRNMRSFIAFYNTELNNYISACQRSEKHELPSADSFVSKEVSQISWSSSLLAELRRNKFGAFRSSAICQSLYRPFQKQWLYFDGMFNHRVGQMPRIFPDSSVENRVICLTVTGTKGFSIFISDCLPDLHLIGDSQCFPLHLYAPLKPDNKPTLASSQTQQADLLDTDNSGLSTDGLDLAEGHAQPRYTIKDGITDAGLAHFQAAYPDENITKEDLFYYIYGLLHSEDYQARYADNLTKELPRIPCVAHAADFWAFSQAGRELAELHIHYETVDPYPVNFAGGTLFMHNFTDQDYRVERMKFAKNGKETDKTTVIYNHKITMTGIPLQAYDYVVNGKPALEWVMERQSVTTHKDSGIINDANLWATETVGNARYPLELFQRVITVSLRTMAIVRGLPKLDGVFT